ncbi:hypothetical protein RND71_035310 [Anisodus tanguticus]|uniref:B-like cyclin n=1 Tax=Anisodus tanguticus TaxID=243964 RepID=A0AAE1R419_9SOLA|nr:hypothetical protein RND71_035310 [Anisodus tanguticus]
MHILWKIGSVTAYASWSSPGISLSYLMESTSKSQVYESNIWQKQEGFDSLGISGIDSRHKDPLLCSLPSIDYMEKLQLDINKGMRGILIDWLVEISEEYMLVPDTLYLTANLIVRFLFEYYIEKQKLQLLGVACMLIASRVDDQASRECPWIWLASNKNGKQSLEPLELSACCPTTMKFLRRFIQAAQASYKVPSVELEFMANYLAELTLVDYYFLEFLPPLIAASVVFLARWTLDPSNHPMDVSHNPTLEYYTRYKVSELRTTVFALQDLQMNTDGCTLNAIRKKYRQPKFEGANSSSKGGSATVKWIQKLGFGGMIPRSIFTYRVSV